MLAKNPSTLLAILCLSVGVQAQVNVSAAQVQIDAPVSLGDNAYCRLDGSKCGITGAITMASSLTVSATAGLTANASNGALYVDGCASPPPPTPRFACSAAGIQAAINVAALSAPGSVIIPPGTVAMGGTGLTLPSSVCLFGSGMNATTLRFSSAPAVAAIFVGSGVNNACAMGMTLSFATATNGANAIRVGNGSQSSAIEFNSFRDIAITFDSVTTSGTAAIRVNGASGVATALNHFENIIAQMPVFCVLTNLAEGNTYYMDCTNAGGNTDGIQLVSETGSNDERYNIRVESGSVNGTGDVCFANTASGGSGYGHLVTLTCDLSNGGTAINESGTGAGYSYYDISSINSAVSAPTLGAVAPTSHYRFLAKANSTTTAQTPTLIFPGSTSGTVTVSAPAVATGTMTVGGTLCSTSQKSETGSADTNVLTCTPAGAAGTYRVCAVVSVSSATSGVISWTLSWTDSNGNAQSNVAQDLFQQGTAAPNTTFTTSAAGNYHGCSTIDVNNAAANIVVKWVGGGTATAKMSATVERIM